MLLHVWEIMMEATPTYSGSDIFGSVGVAICIGLDGARETALECIPSIIMY